MKVKEKDGLQFEFRKGTISDLVEFLEEIVEEHNVEMNQQEEHDFDIYYEFYKKHRRMSLHHQLNNIKCLIDTTFSQVVKQLEKEELKEDANNKADSERTDS